MSTSGSFKRAAEQRTLLIGLAAIHAYRTPCVKTADIGFRIFNSRVPVKKDGTWKISDFLIMDIVHPK